MRVFVLVRKVSRLSTLPSVHENEFACVDGSAVVSTPARGHVVLESCDRFRVLDVDGALLEFRSLRTREGDEELPLTIFSSSNLDGVEAERSVHHELRRANFARPK